MQRMRDRNAFVALLDILLWGGLLGQYIAFFAISGAMWVATIGELAGVFVIVGLATWLLVATGLPWTEIPLRRLNGLLFLLFSGGHLALLLLYNGPFDIPLAFMNLGATLLNALAAAHQWRGVSFKSILQALRRFLCPWRTRISAHPRKLLAGALTAILVCIAGWAFVNSFWLTVTVQAPAGATTTSSFWGNPDLAIRTWRGSTSPTGPSALLLSPATLQDPPKDFAVGGLAYVKSITVPGSRSDASDSTLVDYASGTSSSPGGSVILSTPLPQGTTEVIVEFAYVQNWQVLQWLSETHATIILNGFDMDDRVESRSLFQLLEYWQIPYTLQVCANNEYSHVFNAFNVQPKASEILTWAARSPELQRFQGLSFDCEQEDYPQSPLNQPGYRPLFPGKLIPDRWPVVKKIWYWMNEQDPATFRRAIAAYDATFAQAESLQKGITVVLGPSDFSEIVDGDQDHHANPTLPLSQRPNVRYGQMSYQDNKPQGRFACYRDCMAQIKALGDRGQSILLGWMAEGSSYYTDDEQGFQRYLEDCRIAQAAGMTEIFHAPLYGVQHKWGDQTILRLHKALNEDPKVPVTFRVQQFTNLFFWDLFENFNRVAWWVVVYEVIVIASLAVRKVGLWRRQQASD